MNTSKSLYQDVITTTTAYLGPKADRFVTRQIQQHLHKEPEHLNEDDLVALLDWIRVASNLLTDDTKLVHDYIQRLQSLTRGASHS